MDTVEHKLTLFWDEPAVEWKPETSASCLKRLRVTKWKPSSSTLTSSRCVSYPEVKMKTLWLTHQPKEILLYPQFKYKYRNVRVLLQGVEPAPYLPVYSVVKRFNIKQKDYDSKQEIIYTPEIISWSLIKHEWSILTRIVY